MNCMEHLLRVELNRDWLTLMLIGALALLGVLRYWFPKRMSELLLLPVNDKYFALEGRQKALIHPFNISMLVIQLVTFGIMFSGLKGMGHSPHHSLQFNEFTTGVFFISLYLIMRYALDWCIGYVFNCQKVLAAYRYQRLSFHHLISIGILFFLATLFFSRLPWAILWDILSIVLIFPLVATLIYSVRRNSTTIIKNFFYFILYICALEIAPYVLLYQAAMT